ncbi:Imm50 family immunity protein [Streptomyces sp. SYSU K217416]
MTWTEFLRNPEVFTPFYDTVPDLSNIRLRSIHLDRRGPTVTLRLDFPRLPDRMPKEWGKGAGDTLQCHVQFLAVEHFTLQYWEPPVTAARISLRPRAEHRVGVETTGDGVTLSFECSDSLLAGHIGMFSRDTDGSDTGTHHFARKLDSIRYTSIPPTYEKAFYERV